MKFYLLIIFSIILVSCSGNAEIDRLKNLNKGLSEKLSKKNDQLQIARKAQLKLQFLASKLEGIKAKITTNHGEIMVKFYPDIAPIHVFTFVTRAESGYYDGTQFHRVMKGFMIQGGDPNTKEFPNNYEKHGIGGPITMIPHEFSETKHKRGVLSTARVGDKSVGAGSQFFIMHQDYPSLDNNYTVFGEVTKGIEVVDKIVDLPQVTAGNNPNHPKKPVIIKSIKVFK